MQVVYRSSKGTGGEVETHVPKGATPTGLAAALIGLGFARAVLDIRGDRAYPQQLPPEQGRCSSRNYS